MKEPGRSSNSNLLWYLLPFALAIILIGALYLPTFWWWWYEWTAPGSFYAHAIFVPFFVAVMIWRHRERLSLVRWRPNWSGMAFIVIALTLLMLSKRSDVTIVQSISFMLLLLGMALLTLGLGKTRILLFPLLFIMMMMPLVPDQLINIIAFPIQITSAKIATLLLNIFQMPSIREGTMIRMENYKMAVELPCSGFKTLVSLITFSAAFAYLVDGAQWKRWTLFWTTLPLSLMINALRIAMIGMVGEMISTKAAGIFHDYSGFIVLILAFLFLFNFARLLKCDRFLGIPLNDEEEKRDALLSEQEASAGPEPAWWQVLLAWRPTTGQLKRIAPYTIALDLILLVALSVQGIVVKKSAAKPPIATFQLPSQFVSSNVTWTADKSAYDYDKLTKDVQEALKPMRVLNRTYTSSNKAQIQFFLTAGNGRYVFHDPHTCSLGSDATLQDVGVIEVSTKDGPVKLLESVFKRTGSESKYEMMFCYVVEGKIVQDTRQVRTAMIRQMLLGDSGMPSYFFRTFQTSAGTEEQKREELKNFIAGIWDQIGPILKGEKPGMPDGPPVPAVLPGGDK